MLRTLCQRIVPPAVGLALLAYPAGPVHGQVRGGSQRMFVVPGSRTMPTPKTPAPMTANPNRLIARDARLGSTLRRGLRRDALARQFHARNGYGMQGAYGGFGASGYSPGSGGYSLPASEPASAYPLTPAEVASRVALLKEQVTAERLANRRRAIDQATYEREKAFSPEQELLRRSRTNPGPGEVASGDALNALMGQLRRQANGTKSQSLPDLALPFDAAGLKHINMTRGPGNMALLRNGGRLHWPTALTGADLQEPRERLVFETAAAVRQAARGSLDPGVIHRMTVDVERMRQFLHRGAKNVDLQAFAAANAYLRKFDDALLALRQPDAANHFTGAYELKATTVLELVHQMTQNGLRFAPALAGDEGFYAALRESLVACERATLPPP